MDRKITLVSSWLLAAIFLYAGVDKLLHFGGFERALESYAILPAGYGRYLALPLILVELWVGIGLLRNRWRRSAALCATGLLGLFTLALAVNHWINPQAICGCWFTITLSRSTEQHLLQNLVMAGLALLIFLTETSSSGGTSENSVPEPAG